MRRFVRRSVPLVLAVLILLGFAAYTSSPQEAQPNTEATPTVNCNGTHGESLTSEAKEVKEYFGYLASDERERLMCAALAKNGPKVMKAITDGHLGPFTKGYLTPSTFKLSGISGNLHIYTTEDEKFQVVVELEADEVTIHRFLNITVFDGSKCASIWINGKDVAVVVLENPKHSASSKSSTKLTQRAQEGKPDLGELKRLDDQVLDTLNNWTAEPKSTKPTRFKSIV